MIKYELRGLIREEIENVFEQITPSGSITASCNVSQAAISQIAGPNPQLGDLGINQNFINNMAGKTPNFYLNRRQAFKSKREALEISGQAYCEGENPNWQVKLMNKERYVLRCHMAYNHTVLTPC